MRSLKATVCFAAILVVTVSGKVRSRPGNGQSSTQQSVKSAQVATLKPLEILIDWQAEPTYLGIYFAKDKGYFSALGYSATVVQSWGANQAVAAIASGRYSIGTASGGATVLGYNNGAKVVSLGVLYPKISTVVYGLATQQVSKPPDLKGKRIGIYPGSITNNEFEAFLKINHIQRRDIQVVSLSGPDIPLLLAHQVDAVLHYTEMSPVILGNDKDMPLVKGRRVFELRLSDYGVRGYGVDVVTSQNAWRKNKDTLISLSKAIYRGYKDGCANRSDAVALFLTEFPAKDPDYVRRSWDRVCTLVGEEPGSQTAQGWMETIELYRDLGLLTAPVTPSDILGDGRG